MYELLPNLRLHFAIALVLIAATLALLLAPAGGTPVQSPAGASVSAPATPLPPATLLVAARR